MDELEISNPQLDVIADHVLADLPRECCGVLLGRREVNRARVEAVRTAPNVAAEPTSGYEIEPRTLVSVQREARAEGLEIVGYYHSHPGGRAVPSGRDREAAWPGTSYLIVGTRDGVVSEHRSWLLGPDGRFDEQSMRVVGRSGHGEVTE